MVAAVLVTIFADRFDSTTGTDIFNAVENTIKNSNCNNAGLSNLSLLTFDYAIICHIYQTECIQCSLQIGVTWKKQHFFAFEIFYKKLISSRGHIHPFTPKIPASTQSQSITVNLYLKLSFSAKQSK